MTARTPRVAANPIPYWSARGKTREVFEEAFADFQRIGFTAVKADIPEGMTADEYRSATRSTRRSTWPRSWRPPRRSVPRRPRSDSTGR
jgi:hypothetical protein